MPKRKATDQPVQRQRIIFQKEELMVEAVYLVLQHNLYENKASNDMTLIEYAKKLNVEELRQFNSKLKEILSHTK